MALEFKEHLKKAHKIDIRLKSGKFYACSKEQVTHMANTGSMSESNVRSLFTKKSADAHFKAKADAQAKAEAAKAKKKAADAKAKAKAEAEANNA